MRDITFRDLARRYGYFLDYVQRTEGLDLAAGAAAYVTLDRVNGFVAELQARVGSVTVHGSIYKLRRMAQLLDPIETSRGSLTSKRISLRRCSLSRNSDVSSTPTSSSKRGRIS